MNRPVLCANWPTDQQTKKALRFGEGFTWTCPNGCGLVLVLTQRLFETRSRPPSTPTCKLPPSPRPSNNHSPRSLSGVQMITCSTR